MFYARKRLIRTCLFIIISTFFIMGARVAIADSSEAERVAKLSQGAKSEGSLVWYSTMTIPDMATVTKKFEEKYPFIKVQSYRAATVNLLQKFIGEERANKHTADVIGIPGFQATVLKKEGLYARYISPESQGYQEGFRDPDGTWTNIYTLPYLMGYNTRLLSRKDIPDTYEGFLVPRWKGRKIGFDTKEVEFFANMLKIMGEEKGMDFFRKLVAQELSYRQGHELIVDLIVAGEFPVGTVYSNGVDNRKKKGAAVDWVGVAPVIAKINTIALTAQAPHPNAAKLFIDFCLSKEGQTVIASLGRLPARTDIEADTVEAFKGIKIYPSDLTLADKFADYSKQFAKVLRLR